MVFITVLKESANNFESGVKDVMLSENLDNDHTMPYHEVGLLNHASNANDQVMQEKSTNREVTQS